MKRENRSRSSGVAAPLGLQRRQSLPETLRIDDHDPSRRRGDLWMRQSLPATLRVLHLADRNDRATWEAIRGRHGITSLWDAPERLELWSRHLGGEGVCLFLETPTGAVLYPFLRRRVRDERGGVYADLTSPYGGGGPRGLPIGGVFERERVGRAFERVMAHYCRTTGVVAEFALLHPKAFAPHLTREARGEVVRVDLTRSPAAIWTGYSPTLRNTIRRVRQRGFTLHFFEDARGFPFFHPIYRETMERRRAAPFYHFPPAFFEDLHRSLSGRFLYGVVFDGASPISAELCLTDGEELVSLLGGTTTHALPEAANPLLRDGLIRWGRAHRFRIYDLGGGRTAGDSLFRYKRKFGRNDVVPAVVGYRIWNRRIYDRLCAAAGVDGRRETFFPAYRKGERG